MSLDDMIKQAQENGLISICPFTLRGKPEATFGMLSIMAKTEPVIIDPDWWRNRMWGWRN